MTRTLRYLLLFALTGISASAFAQGIAGRVQDDKKELLLNATVQVFQGGILKGGAVSDYDGNYVVKPLDPGYYDVVALYTGYDSFVMKRVVVSGDNNTTLNIVMKRAGDRQLGEVIVRTYKKPIIDIDNPGSKVMTSDVIARIPTQQTADLVSTAGGTYQSKRGQAVNMSGARASGTVYFVDGVQVRSSTGAGSAGIDQPQGGIDQLEVITSGIPAKYGDVAGGVVNITTRGVSQKFTGNFRLQHSIEGFNNNLASFSIAGPLLKRKVPGQKEKKPALGFALSGDFYLDNDRYPFYDRQYEAKPEVLGRMQENPLHITTGNSGAPVYYYASEFATLDDFRKTKVTPSRRIQENRINGKLDYQLTDNMRIVGGGTFNYMKDDVYSRARSLFDAGSTPERNNITARAFLRFTQKFGKANDSSKSIISNAFYSVQADYQKTYQDQHDPTFKEDIFKYAYIGKFTESRQDIYVRGGIDSVTGRQGTVLTFSTPTKIDFQRSELNPILANYTSQYYRSRNENLPTSINQIQFGSGLANGDEPRYTYDMFFSPGATQSAYTKFNSNQYALTVSASFDLKLGKTTHAIEFGLYYQQRIERQFIAYANPNGTGTQSLWSQMRQLVSSVNSGKLIYDKANPIFVVGGKQYTVDQINAGAVIPGPNDTILYNYKNVGQTTFDKNLRKRLGKGDNENIDIDALDPNKLSLDLFSADELLNSGNGFVYYYGYNYTGGAQGAVNYNDFWTKKDANGNYTRPVGAFSPNYIAGYIMDRFTYKDLHFNVGVRVDRFSANTKVLIDPYSLYPERRVSDVAGSANSLNGGVHPTNMGGNYVVYVDDNNSSAPSIVGYRSGNNWYDPSGNAISDPNTLKQYSGGRPIQPYLVKNANGDLPKITDTTFNPNGTFTDYVPQVTVQPRLSFNFPISEDADFYAHYDIYAQRPESNINTLPADYFFLASNSNQIINNPNLRSQKTFDYEVGFQQKLSQSSGLTINAFYKERKDQIAIMPVMSAWPATYYTYGNRDFSTTKGTTLNYDLRATNHLRMTIAYTLQFAEGTGSTPTSGNSGGTAQISANGLLQSFIQAGLPNMRYVTALDFDSRHIISANIDYRYNEDEGPVVAGRHILQRAGVDFIVRTRSGEPYTRYTDAQGSTVIGGLNGSRLPWHFGVDMRIDKDFAINNLSKKSQNAPAGVKAKRPLFLRAILQVNNLLQTREILNVYGYTGRPDDDGYLNSAYGQQRVPLQNNPISYYQMYQININNPNNLNYARTIAVGLEFNF